MDRGGNTKPSSGVRTAPPTSSPNNQDVFIWALFVLGGADHDVDVEDVFLKSFELAPARLGWRTRPDLPDYKKAAKALQSVEASTHVGLVHRTSQYLRRLTADGVDWVERNRPILSRVYGGDTPVGASTRSAHERRRRDVRASSAFLRWHDDGELQLADLADALECSPASPKSVWEGRLIELRRASEVLSDEELRAFADAADRMMKRSIPQ